MRAAFAALVLLFSMSACAIVPPAAGGPATGYRELRAHITSPSHGLGFYVNRPAYVALFELIPGRGASMVYPSPGVGRMDGFVFSGMQRFHGWRRHNAGMYLPALGGSASMQPRFFFLIASERPLELARLGGFGMGLRSAMGLHFASTSAYDAMERIAEIALPSTVPDGSWTTDMYVDWPQVLHSSPRNDRVLVSCNGYQVFVPLHYLAAVRSTICQADENGRQPRAVPGDSSRVRGDSSEVVEPQRRRPLPRAEESLRERITSSVQMEAAARRGGVGSALGPEARERHRPGLTKPGGREVRDGGTRDRERPRLAPSEGQDRPRAETPRASPPPRPRAAPRARPRVEPREPAPARRPSGGAEPRARPAVEKPSSGCNPCELL